MPPSSTSSPWLGQLWPSSAQAPGASPACWPGMSGSCTPLILPCPCCGWRRISKINMAGRTSRWRWPTAAGCRSVRAWADFAIEGWAFLQIAVWHPQDWQVQLDRALDEMQRVVRPGGKMILIETLGTGESVPKGRTVLPGSVRFPGNGTRLRPSRHSHRLLLRDAWSRSSRLCSRSSGRRCSNAWSGPRQAGCCRNVPVFGVRRLRN